jgi:hypothetical protein
MDCLSTKAPFGRRPHGLVGKGASDRPLAAQIDVRRGGIPFWLVKAYKSTLRREKRSIEHSQTDQGAG